MIAPSLCDICKNYGGRTCKAFPEGNIPDEFFDLKHHFEKHPSQKNDILFELDVKKAEGVRTMNMKLLQLFIDEYNKKYYGGEPYVSYDKEKKEVIYNTQIKKTKEN